MRVRLFEVANFVEGAPAVASRGNRVFAAWFDDQGCLFDDHSCQLDEQCQIELIHLMGDLCDRANSGLPIAECYGADAWHALREVSFRCGSTMISVPIFRLTRRNVSVIGFVARKTDIVVYACMKKRASLKKADESSLETAIRQFCESQRLGKLLIEQ